MRSEAKTKFARSKITSDGVLETAVSARDRFFNVSARLETFLLMSRSRLGLETQLETVTPGSTTELIEPYITFITSDERIWVDVKKSYAHYELIKTTVATHFLFTRYVGSG